MVTRSARRFATRPGFAAGIVMSTPPFPYARPDVMCRSGLPVLFDHADRRRPRHLHYGEVGLQNGQLVTSGAYGWTLVVTGMDPSIREAQQRGNRLAARVTIPNVRYRRDIGDRLIAGDFYASRRLGCSTTARDDGTGTFASRALAHLVRLRRPHRAEAVEFRRMRGLAPRHQHPDPLAIAPVFVAEHARSRSRSSSAMPTKMYAVVTAANSRCPAVITGAAQNAMMKPR